MPPGLHRLGDLLSAIAGHHVTWRDVTRRVLGLYGVEPLGQPVARLHGGCPPGGCGLGEPHICLEAGQAGYTSYVGGLELLGRLVAGYSYEGLRLDVDGVCLTPRDMEAGGRAT